MADIKLTLSQNSRLRSRSIKEEAQWMEEEGPIYYNLGRNKPLHAEEGCWVYFIRAGRLAGRARADRIGKLRDLHPNLELVSYTGEEQPVGPESWQVACRKMEIASHPVPHEGFQGFRYVRPEEQKAFENAFRKNKS
jgi:hypothetical protein